MRTRGGSGRAGRPRNHGGLDVARGGATGLLLVTLLLCHLQHGTPSRRVSPHLDSDQNQRSRKNMSDATAGPARYLDARRVEVVGEFAAAVTAVDNGRPFDEPPSLTNVIPDEWVHRCSSFDKSCFEHGAGCCGRPFSGPCFDWTRCQAEGGPKIYVYDQECSEADSKYLHNTDHTEDDPQHQGSYWVEAARRTGMLADTYEEACLFIHVNTHNHDRPCAFGATLWNGGVNHVMMEFTPWWRPPHTRTSDTYAMDWAFDTLSCHYRSGFDLSVPLRPAKVFPELESTSPLARKHFMTFRGTLYLRGYGLEERSAVSRIHDPANRIVSVTACSDMNGEDLMPENRDYCDRSRERYHAYGYVDLMNTTFALVPAGRSPGTFRLGEVMSAGAIPVFVVRDWVKPFQETIDWASFSFSFSPDDVGTRMVEVLRAVPPDELKKMQRMSIEAYWKIFGGVTDYSVIAANTIDVLIQRLGFHR